MTFQNILVSRDMWSAIDYEWAVDRAIPVRELLYRSVLCYFAEGPWRREAVEALLTGEGLLQLLDVDSEQARAWAVDEENFQKSVTGNAMAYGSLVQAFGTQVIKPGELQSEEEKQAHMQEEEKKRLEEQARLEEIERRKQELTEIRIYEDTGAGFSEEHAYAPAKRYADEGIVSLELNVSPSVRALRLDPANCPCVCLLHHADVEGAGEALLERYRKTNAVMGGNVFVFGTHDPWIVWDMEKIRKKLHRKDAFTLRLTLQMNGIASTMAEAVRA